jgi:ankyrin repeat protein
MIDQNGHTALHDVANCKDATDDRRQIANMLCERGITINAQTNDGSTALHYAASSGLHHVVRLLCERGATVDAVDKDGCTPLWHAAWYCESQHDLLCCDDNWHLIRILIEAGAGINARSHHGQTVLLAMLDYNVEIDIAILDKLIRAGANTQSRDEDGISVLRACFDKSFAKAVLMTICVARGHDEATSDRVYARMQSICQEFNDNQQREKMIIYLSAKEGSEDLRLILTLGADIDTKSEGAGTAMHSAVRRDDCNAIDRLVAAGASLECFDHKGRTPLAVAVRYKCTRALRRLVRHGSNPRAKGPESDARTALEIATKQRDRTILKILKRPTEMLSSSGSESADPPEFSSMSQS